MNTDVSVKPVSLYFVTLSKLGTRQPSSFLEEKKPVKI